MNTQILGQCQSIKYIKAFNLRLGAIQRPNGNLSQQGDNRKKAQDRAIVEIIRREINLWSNFDSKVRWKKDSYDLVPVICGSLTNFHILHHLLRIQDSTRYDCYCCHIYAARQKMKRQQNGATPSFSPAERIGVQKKKMGRGKLQFLSSAIFLKVINSCTFSYVQVQYFRKIAITLVCMDPKHATQRTVAFCFIGSSYTMDELLDQSPAL